MGVAGVLAIALVAGGSSSDAAAAALIVRLASLPLLGLGLWRLASRGVPGRAAWPMLLLGAIALVTLLQLLPLPAAAWGDLPTGRLQTQLLKAAGLRPGRLPLSLTPEATWDAFLGLIPPAAMFAAGLTLTAPARRRVAAVLVAMGVVSALLGALQMAGGEASPLRLYAATDPGTAVGFFANRNHQAALLVVALGAAIVLGLRQPHGAGDGRGLAMAVTGAAMVVLLIGIGMTTSRAGVMLAAPTVAAAISFKAFARPDQGRPPHGTILAAAGAALVGVVLAAALNLTSVAARFDSPLSADLRREVVPATLRLAEVYAPLGSGVGSFPIVYETAEKPETLRAAYANHAHNDYAELWLEAGWPAVTLILAFAGWWAGMGLGAFRGSDPNDRDLFLLGSLILAVLLIHSTVDYPLRCPALLAVFAFACSLCVPPVEPRGEVGAA